jgi:hypothetical protein
MSPSALVIWVEACSGKFPKTFDPQIDEGISNGKMEERWLYREFIVDGLSLDGGVNVVLGEW